MLGWFVGDAQAHGISPEAIKNMIDGGYAAYIGLGAEHMLTGYDHLLFLFGVIFFLYRFKDVLKFISAFTLGHSVTLILATFLGIKANAYLIDAVIALTVIYKGFENLDGFKRYLDLKVPNLLSMVFLFGLIHGFGLSTRLQQLPLDFEPLELLGRIVAFNVGVELGQITALAVMIVLISMWRHSSSFRKFSRLSNLALVFVGFLLFMMQVHGYQHTAQPDDFGFSEDNHYHAHEKIDQQESRDKGIPEPYRKSFFERKVQQPIME
ncbi:MAG: HupE/UreJ family protein [bacterium]|nr:HupE/UreJ family protein [bacterium]